MFRFSYRPLRADYSVNQDIRNEVIEGIFECRSLKFTYALLHQVPQDSCSANIKTWSTLLSEFILMKENKHLLELILNRKHSKRVDIFDLCSQVRNSIKAYDRSRMIFSGFPHKAPRAITLKKKKKEKENQPQLKHSSRRQLLMTSKSPDQPPPPPPPDSSSSSSSPDSEITAKDRNRRAMINYFPPISPEDQEVTGGEEQEEEEENEEDNEDVGEEEEEEEQTKKRKDKRKADDISSGEGDSDNDPLYVPRKKFRFTEK